MAMCDQNIKSAWKTYIETHVKEDISQILLHHKTFNDYPLLGDQFYDDIFQLWVELHNKKPTSGQMVCNQTICNNSFIRISGKPITTKIWKHHHVKYIQDIIDRNGNIDNRRNIEKKYDIIIDPLLYNGISCAIPKDWKRILKDDINANNYHVFADYNVTIDGKEKKMCELTSKDVYWHLIKKIEQRATSESKWELETGINYDENKWQYAYTYPYNLTKDVRILSFHYKITHRIFACKRNLKTWKIEKDNICDTCGGDIIT